MDGVTQAELRGGGGPAADLPVGTVARVVKLVKMQGRPGPGLARQGLPGRGARGQGQYLKARVDPDEDKSTTDDVEAEALAINLKKLAR